MVDLTKLDNPSREPYKFDNELFSIDEVLELKKKNNKKKVICTHLDCNWSNTSDVLAKYEQEQDDIAFAYDGMIIDL